MFMRTRQKSGRFGRFGWSMLAAAIAIVGLSHAPAHADLQEVGRAAAVNPRAEGTPPGEATRRLLLGDDVFFEERIVTSGQGQTQILFTDQSSLAIGPNSEVIINSYVYDPDEGTGEMVMSLVEGLIRYVGGEISKRGNTTVDTPTTVLGIRGGIGIVSHNTTSGVTNTSNVFGRQTLRVNGDADVVPQGFSARIGPGGEVDFFKTDVGRIRQFQKSLEGTGDGGATERPSDDRVAAAQLDRGNSALDPDLALARAASPSGLAASDTSDSTQPPAGTEDTTETTRRQPGDSSVAITTTLDFGNGRLLSTPDRSYGTYFNTIVGDPFGQNFVGGPDPAFDEPLTAEARVAADGQGSLRLSLVDDVVAVPYRTGTFPVSFQTSLDAETRAFAGDAFVDAKAGFATYAVQRTDGAGAQELGSFDIDPEASFLRLAPSDNAPPASAIDLADLGLAPGDTLVIRRRGDRTSLSEETTERQRGFIAVFSSSDQLGPAGQTNRVVGAIDAGFDVTTPPTLEAGSPSTDIPEDFAVPTFERAQTVIVPDGAQYLFIAANDQFYEDNRDLNGDYGVDLVTYRPGERAFLFSGVPTPNGGKLESPAVTVTAYEVRPEAFMGSEVPFLPPRVADNFAAPHVSPVYILRREGDIVVDTGADVFPGPGVSRSRFMQASLGIEGEGAAQQSFLVVTDTPLAASTEGKLFISSGLRGSVRLDAEDPRFRISGDVGSVPSQSGDHFFGPDLDYFILNNNGIGQNDEVPDLEFGAPDLIPTNFDQQVSEVYGYVHVAARTDAPGGLGTQRTPERTLSGYAAGMGQSADFVEAVISAPYVLQGANGDPDALEITNHAENTTSAVFRLSEPLESSFVDTATLAFGGDGTSNGSFIDDRVFAARQSRTIPSTLNGAAGSPESIFAPFGVRGAFVSSETVMTPGTEILGQPTCACEYLSWGFWSAEYRNADDSRREHIHLGSWVAGDLPEPGDLPTSGVAEYTGHAIGEVANGSRQYIAAGAFTNTWDFGKKEGQVRIDGFDGRDFVGTAVSEGDSDYGGAMSGPDGISGRIDGSFFEGGGDPAAETGGQFHLEGPEYRASGTFAGRK